MPIDIYSGFYPQAAANPLVYKENHQPYVVSVVRIFRSHVDQKYLERVFKVLSTPPILSRPGRQIFGEGGKRPGKRAGGGRREVVVSTSSTR